MSSSSFKTTQYTIIKGVFNQTKGFAMGNGVFGNNNRGLQGIKYRGGWSHGEVTGYGKLEQCQPIRIHDHHQNDVTEISIYQGRMLNGLKDGYGISRYSNNEIFYKGEYKEGKKDGYGTRYILSGKTNHNVTYSNPPVAANKMNNGPAMSEYDVNSQMIAATTNNENSPLTIESVDEAGSDTLSPLGSPSTALTPSRNGNKSPGSATAQSQQGGLWLLDYPVSKGSLLLMKTPSDNSGGISNPASPKSPVTPSTHKLLIQNRGNSGASSKSRKSPTSPDSNSSSSPKPLKQFTKDRNR
jgi:antitoxin component YwqK of YwqJK toxin-antitoxin module